VTYDIIIVGGGSAGCVLAGELSASGRHRVLLIENGPDDRLRQIRHWVDMPKGLVKLIARPELIYTHPTDAHLRGIRSEPEYLLRGRMLGGSGSINGMVWLRGQPQDFERWQELGLPGWGWSDMLRCYKAVEDHCLPPTDFRGPGGRVPITMPDARSALNDAIFAAAADIGLPRKEEPNLPEQLGISYVAANINRRGRRVSAARAYLTPSVRRRSSLSIVTNTRVERVLFRDGKAVGVEVRQGEQRLTFEGAEIVLSAGAIDTPVILERSGVGAAERLQSAGIAVKQDLPGVGENYRDHWVSVAAFALNQHRHSHNREFRGWRLLANALRYFVAGTGPLSGATHQLAIFGESRPGLGRADIELLVAPYWLVPTASGMKPTEEPAMHFNCFALRGDSQGRIHVSSADPAMPPTITPNNLATDYDRRATVAALRLARRFAMHETVRPFIRAELPPTAGAETDEELIEVALRHGMSGLHACGTCKMGADGDPMAVVDARLRVRGIGGLRVVDCSVMPEQVSANTNATVMAIAYRASELIREDLGN
jgi:choline dehydrogenase